MTGRAARRVAVVAVTVAALLAGCGAGARPTTGAVRSGSSTPGSPAPDPPPRVDPLPDTVLAAVGAELRQSRADWGDRVVQVRVRNDGAAPLTVTGVELTADTVEGTAVADPDWARTVPAGSHRDASVALGAPVCGAGPTAPEAATSGAAATPALHARVRVHLADDAGRTGERTLEAQDPQGHLARIRGEDCAAAAVARGLHIEPLGPLTVADRDGVLVATVTLALDPAPGGPPVTLDRVDGTILLAPVGGPAWTAPLPPGPVTVPATVTLDATPGRCDAHAVAEDKRGSFLGLHTSVDGVAQPVFYLPLGEDLRGAIHDYIAQACGWPDG